MPTRVDIPTYLLLWTPPAAGTTTFGNEVDIPTFLLLWTPPAAGTTSLGFKAAIVAAVKADATLTGLIGGRIEPQRNYQPDIRPAITYAVQRNWGVDLDGRDGSIQARVAFSVHATTLDEAESIINALADALGNLQQATLSGLTILASWPEDDPDSYDWPDDASDDGTFTDVLTISFLYLK